MKNVRWLLFLMPIVLIASSCRDGARLTVLFTGDERGWVVPAG